ncbi:GatB/YqeY domain-containing protein [Patescibacteria group bacterium]|nr:GatB/YqeY domain-containing protein [Patescibacteria group bacterium]MBU1500976.1 GatB/YqeY domain-containing protein [Patescibacteria group bacterium]MBU2080606.1 GatB/YqeY domain-containing protein [Patescibacteria group bacterium]MBU2124319.1 GatB/YqeY domain-containing protein [Patescibacteria group bacterium]MBU2194445.1 GatB/YqeY domain-containing protein [Patescibacteria group bacterium]
MTLHETIKAGIPDALRAKDAVRLRTLRSLASAMTNEVVAKKRKPDEFLTDEEALVVVKRAANQRKDSIEQFTAAGRTELAEPEIEELAVIESFMPELMSKEEIHAIASQKMQDMNITEKKDTGRFIGALMQDLKGKADGADVKEVVDSLLR